MHTPHRHGAVAGATRQHDDPDTKQHGILLCDTLDIQI